MPEKKTIERAREDARKENRPSTQAGEFIREEMEHTREGKYGARMVTLAAGQSYQSDYRLDADARL
jgi:hypothetical protein